VAVSATIAALMTPNDTAQLLAALPPRISAIARRWAALTPQAPALHDAGRYWSYAELADAVKQAAALLRAWQLRPGDRLAVIGENCIGQVVLTFAAADLDVWIVPVNGRLAAREVDQVLRHSGARRALYLPLAMCPETATHAARHGAQPVDTPCGQSLLGPLNMACVPEPTHAAAQEQVAALLYTTGTTGQPKGVMLSHRNLLYVAAVSSALRGVTPQDRVYGVLPLSHVYGLTSVLLGTLYAGACLYLCPRFSVDALLAALHDQRLSIVQGVPAMYARLLEKLGDATPLPTQLRFAYAGGSPLSPDLKARVEKLLGLPLHNGYGLTESAPTVSQTRLDQPRSDTSVGHAIPGVEVRVTVLGNDPTCGELQIRGPNVMLGYYREAELSAAAIDAEGWLNTGDLVRQHADGALFIVGRSKELIIRSGFNVYPLEVETVLNAHPSVTQSAVVGRGGAHGDEEIVAFVELDPQHPASMATLQHYLADQLAPYKRPSRIVAMDALPAAASGKILKARLPA
jgi:long-chain acyl-CoA synthetase